MVWASTARFTHVTSVTIGSRVTRGATPRPSGSVRPRLGPHRRVRHNAEVPTSVARIDLDAIRANVAVLRGAPTAELMAVVKADGYGHGMLPSARAALDGGATWLGRRDGRGGAGAAGGRDRRARSWPGCSAPDDDWTAPSSRPASTSASVPAGRSTGPLPRRWRTAGPPASTSRSTPGSGGLVRSRQDWPDLVEAAAKAQADGTVDVVGIWSHLAYADKPAHPTIEQPAASVRRGLDVVATQAGLDPQVRHLANSAATLALPGDALRPGPSWRRHLRSVTRPAGRPAGGPRAAARR